MFIALSVVYCSINHYDGEINFVLTEDKKIIQQRQGYIDQRGRNSPLSNRILIITIIY